MNDSSMEQIKELENKLRLARQAYYEEATPIMTDEEYDQLEDQLRSLDPENPLLSEIGSAVLQKVAHVIPMGSLNKAMNFDEFDAWTKKFPGMIFYGAEKMDGGSVSLKYEGGNLTQAVTRGDGVNGEDITHNVLHFKDIPKKNVIIHGQPFTGYIRGEIILDNESWKIVDPQLASNPRNLGVGIAKRKSDSSEAKYLTIYAFRAHHNDGTEVASSEVDNHALLDTAGFKTPVFSIGEPSFIKAFISKIQDKRSSLNYWIDGIVVTVNDFAYQRIFEVKPKPEWSIAVKFPPRAYNTVLRSVEFQVGHTGKIVPVGKFNPVRIDGTDVSSALLCNFSVIGNLDIAIGDTVEIYKAGDIIPRVLRVINRPADRIKIEEPTVCPICGGPVSRRRNGSGELSADIFCTNDECESKVLGKIMRFIHSIDIKELGKTIVTSLINQGKIASCADIYFLTETDIADLILESGRRVGNSTAKKILENISDKTELTVPQILGSVGVYQLGKGRVENIIEVAPEFSDISEWFLGKLNDPIISTRAGVPGIGRDIQESLMDKKDIITRLLQKVTIKMTTNKNVNGLRFCITGTHSRGRKEMAADIEKAGHIFEGSVSAGVNYLVMEDPNSDSGKAKKARSLGVKCISEKELYEILAK